MSGIELFEFPDCQGASCHIDGDIADLTSRDFLKKASSLQVLGDPWVVFTGAEYKGDYKCFRSGKYPSITGFENKISSLRCVKGGLDNPKITLYEHVLYGGQTQTVGQVTAATNMSSSHKVISGAWVLFNKENYQGNKMVTVAGDEFPQYSAFTDNDKVKSLKPMDP